MAGRKREPSQGWEDGVVLNAVGVVDAHSEGEINDGVQVAAAAAAAAQEQEAAKAARERDHWKKTPVRILFPLRSSFL